MYNRSAMLTLVSSPQGRPCCHHHPGQICRKEGKSHLARPEHSRDDSHDSVAVPFGNGMREGSADGGI